MSRRELRAAGVTDPALMASYEACRRLNSAHGKTYYLATKLLPAAKRPYVHALYGFARYADEIVDDLASPLTQRDKAERLQGWGEAFLVDARKGSSDDLICRAVVDTVQRWDIPLEHFEVFLASMTMDLSVTEYATFEDLEVYVNGSAAAIGLQMVHVLGALAPQAFDAARQLGVAFQLANFVRDVGEDLDRGRLYLPIDELARFGLTRADLERRVVDERVVDLLRFQIARVRRLEAAARPGIDLLEPASRPCIDAARELYCGIVEEVEAIDYQVFARRARVPARRRATVAGSAWLDAVRARRSAPVRRPKTQP